MIKSKQSSKIKESPLFWPAKIVVSRHACCLHVLDETLIPQKLHYIKVNSVQGAVSVIRKMKTRAFGQFLVVMNTFLLEINNAGNAREHSILKKIKKTAVALNNSRPTFPFAEVTSIVVKWAESALENNMDIKSFVSKNIKGYLTGIREQRLGRVRKIAEIINDGDSILTHCNVSGELAMAAWICRQQKKEIYFFATETRPYMQGTKLTCWELKRMGAKVTLVADNAIGSLMVDGLINKVIVGSDRSCANGDFANKIGTYQIAILCEEFGIPFFVLTQPSNKIKKGSEIPIEIRKAKEILTFLGKKFVRGSVDGFYPGFDVIPHELITKAIAINVR